MGLCSVPTLHSLLYTTNPQATTYSAYSRSGFSCSPMRKPFSLEPLNLFSEPDPYIFFPLLPSCISAALFFNPYFLFSAILFSPPFFIVHVCICAHRSLLLPP